MTVNFVAVKTSALCQSTAKLSHPDHHLFC